MFRRTAVSRREYRADMGALDAARDARQAQIQDAEDAYEREVERLTQTVVDRGDYGPKPKRAEPAIRSF